MKRCPECEFLYEDEQALCDMDGTRLSFTTTLPALPAPPDAVPLPRSRWAAFTIPLLAVIVMASVLVILYRVAPHGRTSPSDTQTKPASQKALVPNKDAQLETSAGSQPQTGAPADSPRDAEPARDPFVLPKTEGEKDERSAPASAKKTASPGPVSHMQEVPNSQPGNPASTEPRPAMNRVTPITPVPPTGQKSVYSISSHPKPPSAAATPTPRSTMQNSNNNSKMNSLFKKAGRILKKPF